MGSQQNKTKKLKNLNQKTTLTFQPITLDTINEYSQNYNISLTPNEKDFIYIYYKTNSLLLTKNYLDWDMESLINYYKDPKIQDALLFLKKEKNKQIFKDKMLSLEEVGAFLSSHLLDENISESDKFSQKEKLEASRLLLDIHKTINGSLDNPMILNNFNLLDLDMKLENLDVKELKEILHPSTSSSLSSPPTFLPSTSTSTPLLTKENNQGSNQENNQELEYINVDDEHLINEYHKNKIKKEKEKEKISLKKAKKELKYE